MSKTELFTSSPQTRCFSIQSTYLPSHSHHKPRSFLPPLSQSPISHREFMSMPGLLSLVIAGLEATLRQPGSSTHAFNHDIQLDAWRHSKPWRHKKTLLIQRTVGNAVWLKMGLKRWAGTRPWKSLMVCEWRFLFYLPSAKRSQPNFSS